MRSQNRSSCWPRWDSCQVKNQKYACYQNWLSKISVGSRRYTLFYLLHTRTGLHGDLLFGLGWFITSWYNESEQVLCGREGSRWVQNRSGRRNHFPFKRQISVLCSGWHRLPWLRCLAISLAESILCSPSVTYMIPFVTEFYPVRPILFSGTGATLARISLIYAISVSQLSSTFGPTSITTIVARSFYLFYSTASAVPYD